MAKFEFPKSKKSQKVLKDLYTKDHLKPLAQTVRMDDLDRQDFGINIHKATFKRPEDAARSVVIPMLACPSEMTGIFVDIIRERRHQDEKFGPKRIQPFGTWCLILAEEVGEAAQAMLNYDFAEITDRNRKRLLLRIRAELVQVAAVAVAIIEYIDGYLLEKK